MIDIQYLGHSCLMLTIFQEGQDSIKILTDPFISGNPIANQVEISQLKPDYILLSHGHQDHILDLEAICLAHQAKVIAIFEIASILNERGLEAIGFNIGGSMDFGSFSMKMVNAIHSSVLPDGKHGGAAAGYLIYIQDKVIYFSGDTSLTYDMKLIPQYWGKPDICIFPIGGLYTMDIHDALIASDFVECPRVLGCHFDSFEMIKIDHTDAKNLFTDHGKELILLNITESIQL